MGTIIWIAFGGTLGLALGALFNAVPRSWLTEAEEEPSAALRAPRLSGRGAIALASVMALLSMLARGLLAWSGLAVAIAIAAIGFLLLIAIADGKYRIVPDQFAVAVAACGVALVAARGAGGSLPAVTLGALAAAGILCATGRLVERLSGSSDAIGMGDVKLAFAASLLFEGGEWVTFLALASVLGALCAVIVLALRRRSSDSSIPYAPVLAVAAIVTLLMGS